MFFFNTGVMLNIYLFGGDEKNLQMNYWEKNGSNKGMGGSPCIFDLKKIYGHVGLIGDQVPVAVGFSMIKKVKCSLFFGDGS